MAEKWYRFSRLPRNMMLNTAANRSSEPRIIWYTLTVVHTRPVFMRTVATRSKKLGNARASSCFPVTPAGAAAAPPPRSGSVAGVFFSAFTLAATAA